MSIIKRVYRSVRVRIIFLFSCFFRINKRKICISSYYGRGYGDNLKYLVDELLSRNENLKIIWFVKNQNEANSLPKNVTPIIIYSFKYYFHLWTSAVWVDNCRKYAKFKRKNQFYIQTWHGGGAQKKCEKDVLESLDKGYEKSAIEDSNLIDLMVSESDFMTKLYHKSFWYQGPVYECGYPRYDIIFRNDGSIKNKVKKYYAIDEKKSIILYAPTFRKDLSFDVYNIDFNRLLQSAKKRFGHEFVVLVHLHPNIANKSEIIKYDGTTIINSTFYPDTQELLVATDILVGDYSSINYDFSLKMSPVFRYVSDLQDYKKDRNFYFSFEEYPYPYAENNDELEFKILNFNMDEYKSNLTSFFDILGAVRNSESSKCLADLIIKYCCSNFSLKTYLNEQKNLFKHYIN